MMLLAQSLSHAYPHTSRMYSASHAAPLGNTQQPTAAVSMHHIVVHSERCL